MDHEKFHYHSLEEIQETMRQVGVSFPLSENTAVLAEPLEVCGHTVANRIAFQPMEGCDGTPEGRPDELTRQRYERFAKSGAGLIWFEATAVVREGGSQSRGR